MTRENVPEVVRETALLVSTERSRSALFNDEKTMFVRYSVPELWTFIARTYENRGRTSRDLYVHVQLIQLLPVTP